MKTTRSQNLIAALAGVLLIPVSAALAGETNHWRFDTSLNLFLEGLSGDVTTPNIPAKNFWSFAGDRHREQAKPPEISRHFREPSVESD